MSKLKNVGSIAEKEFEFLFAWMLLIVDFTVLFILELHD
jgi:hypothetical protein